jgi:hypothetical protein
MNVRRMIVSVFLAGLAALGVAASAGVTWPIGPSLRLQAGATFQCPFC